LVKRDVHREACRIDPFDFVALFGGDFLWSERLANLHFDDPSREGRFWKWRVTRAAHRDQDPKHEKHTFAHEIHCLVPLFVRILLLLRDKLIFDRFGLHDVLTTALDGLRFHFYARDRVSNVRDQIIDLLIG
jgi:hypothetical protein